MRRIGPAFLTLLAVLAIPAAASAASAWVPGFDEVAPSGNMRTPVTVVTPDLRTTALWVNYPEITAAVRPRGGTFGAPFQLDAGDGSYVPQWPTAVALPDGEVVAAWSGPGDQELRVRSLQPDGTISTPKPTEVGGSRPALAVNAAGDIALAYYSFNQVYLAIRAAGSKTFGSPILLLTLTGNEKPAGVSSNAPTERPLDVTIRDDGQVAVAVGTEILNPPGGTARMLIARYATGTTTIETIDSRALTLTPSPGTTSLARFHGSIELLDDGRQLLVYRLETDTNGVIDRSLYAGPRDGSSQPAPPLLASSPAFGPVFGPKEHGLTVDEAGRPWVWWRYGTGSGEEALRIRQASTAGAFSAPSQDLASPTFGPVVSTTFGAGRTGVLFTQDGVVKASVSDGGAAFGAPVQVAAPAALPSPLASIALAGAGEGSAVAVWPDGATQQASALHATPFDATAPTVSGLAAPASLVAGAEGTFTATVFDDWSVPAVSWLFTGGATLPGASVKRAFPAAGSVTATVTATDAAGNTAEAAKTVTITRAPAAPAAGGPGPGTAAQADTRAPVLSGVRLVPGTLKRGKRTTSLRFTLDEAAAVSVRLQLVRPGFRSGRRCVARRPGTGVAKRCTRRSPVGRRLQVPARAGAGTIPIKRPRARGRYRLEISAADAAGNRSAAQARALTVR